jgi:hypothetical protein
LRGPDEGEISLVVSRSSAALPLEQQEREGERSSGDNDARYQENSRAGFAARYQQRPWKLCFNLRLDRLVGKPLMDEPRDLAPKPGRARRL